MRLRSQYRLRAKAGRVLGALKNVLNRFINFLKGIVEKIYIRVTLKRLKGKIKHLEKLRLICFQEMGEQIYELKKDGSFELIDLAAVNGYMDKIKEINAGIKESREAMKRVKGGKIEGLSSWWSRRGSNP